jgi:hypothetical protein
VIYRRGKPTKNIFYSYSNYFKMRLLLLLTAISFLFCNDAFSQEHRLIGQVLDAETQKPVRNANIIVIGTTSGTVSNHYGFFELIIDPSKYEALAVSHIGFITSKVIIPKEDRFKFFLDKEYVLLEKVNLNLFLKNLNIENQGPRSEDVPVNDKGIHNIESGAMYPNGMKNFYESIGRLLNAELTQIDDKGFDIKFTVNETGRIVDISVSDSARILHHAVVQAFEKLSDWIPAKQQQVNVSQHFVLPIVRTSNTDVKSTELGPFYSFIGQNMKYPLQPQRMGVEGAVYVEFHADNRGNILSIKLLNDIHVDCGNEVKRVISTIPKEITRLLVDNTNHSQFILPVLFGINKSYEAGLFTPTSEALLLSEIYVTALGITKERRVGHYEEYVTNKTVERVVSRTDATSEKLSHLLQKPNQVRRLSLVDNNFTTFPSEVFKFKNMVFLDLEKNQLQNLPNEIFLLSNLQELYLVENKLENLPKNFRNLEKIKVLGLASNRFTFFPDEITYLERLEVLDLSNNQFSSIPSEISRLKNLKVLVLHNNSIHNIPNELYGLKKLKKIYLQGNPIDPKQIDLLKRKFKKAEVVF